MREKGIGLFLRELASSSPTPGGGSAAALTGAMSAALVGMVAELAARRGADAAAAISRAEGLREKLLRLADEDARAYDRVAQALKLPKGTDAERESRRQAIQKALRGAAEVPLETARTCLEVLALAVDFLPQCPNAARSDLACAAALAQAAVEAALYNVDANCLQLRDEALLAEFGMDRENLAREARELAEEVREKLAPDLKAWVRGLHRGG